MQILVIVVTELVVVVGAVVVGHGGRCCDFGYNVEVMIVMKLFANDGGR